MRQIIIAFLLTFISTVSFAQDFPAKPNKLVNDYTGTLTDNQLQQLEQKLVAFDDSTSTQIAIAIIKSVGDYDIGEYAMELGRKWGVGSKGKNNGIMIVAALGDRKISIQTGYGVEGALPDLYVRRIIDNDIKPYFKAGDYYAGLQAGTDAIISYTKGEYKNDKPKVGQNQGGAGSIIVIIIIIIVVIIVLKKGGGNGGGGQVIGSRGVADALFWSMLLGGGRGSGGSSFGGGSGGGFGGFGGGSFGGGGSSGSW
ncbi:TPM domain-containing protein [Pedobacter gandavensis]|uniref:TPM domain-containing protein n=1 Tax=Pedobacter gandavensis TaxID=2679963 RepID=UPI00292E794C|nr:TPM domain-containing protein [Pedobacter gandavensis]